MNIIKKVKDGFNKNSPAILTGVAAGGLIGTTVMAVKSTPRAMAIIEEASRDENNEKIELDWKEKVGLCWKEYIPAAILGGASIACMIGAQSINSRRVAAFSSLYSISSEALKEYKNKVVETIGENKEEKIEDARIKDKIEHNPLSGNDVIITGYGNTLCFDEFTGRYFRSDMETIRKTVNDLNEKMMCDDFVGLNDLYYELGMEQTELGELVGWCSDEGSFKVSFNSKLADNGEPVLVMSFITPPEVYHRRDAVRL